MDVLFVLHISYNTISYLASFHHNTPQYHQKMSMMAKREALIMTVAAVGGLIGANALLKPSPHHSIKAKMDSQLHSYNANVYTGNEKLPMEQDKMYVRKRPDGTFPFCDFSVARGFVVFVVLGVWGAGELGEGTRGRAKGEKNIKGKKELRLMIL